MITVFLSGGLGNQMFQYAAGLNLAKKNNTRLLLDTTFLNDRFPRKQFTYRKFDMDIFDFTPRFTVMSHISDSLPVPGLWLGCDLALINVRSILGIQKLAREKNEREFDPAMLDLGGRTLLWGRWQSEKYFADIKDEVRSIFRFRYPLDEEAAGLAKEINSSNSVALCVRRGDFVAFAKVNKMMGDTNPSYYSNAIHYMNEHLKDPRYFVFTDDVEWCKSNLSVPAGTRFIGKLGPKWSFHLELTSLCKNSIITNSTFYWWGAWINNNPNKIVVAPRPWYADGPDAEDIIPEGWVRV